MRANLFVSLFLHEDTVYYSVITKQKNSHNILHNQCEKKDFIHFLKNIKKAYAKPWSTLYFNFIIPIEKIITKYFVQPEYIEDRNVPLFIKEKIHEIFHVSNHYYYDFQTVKTQHHNLLKTYILSEEYWKYSSTLINESNIKNIILEPETQALHRYIASISPTQQPFIYISRNKIYFFQEDEIKIISIYDQHWLTKSLHYFLQPTHAFSNVFYCNDHRAISIKETFLNKINVPNVTHAMLDINEYHALCLGGLLRLNNE